MSSMRILAAALGLLVLSGCSLGGGTETITVLSWNVQNLFDGKHDGQEYAQFDPECSDWGYEAYHARVKKITDLLRKVDPQLILLQEIEGPWVLEDIAGLLKGGRWSFACSEDERSAIECGLLSRFPIRQIRTHQPATEVYPELRPMLEVEIVVDGEILTLFVCHWISRRSSPVLSEQGRRAAGELLKKRIDSILEEDPSRAIIVGGDLNTDIDESCILSGPSGRALIRQGEQGWQQTIALSGVRSQLVGHSLYDHWLDASSGELEGSYEYRGKWYRFDHLCASRSLFDGSDLEVLRVWTCRDESLRNLSGFPLAYDPYRREGVSDHLPILMTLQVR